MMFERGDTEGQLVWARISRKINKLQAPAAGWPH